MSLIVDQAGRGRRLDERGRESLKYTPILCLSPSLYPSLSLYVSLSLSLSLSHPELPLVQLEKGADWVCGVGVDERAEIARHLGVGRFPDQKIDAQSESWRMGWHEKRRYAMG